MRGEETKGEEEGPGLLHSMASLWLPCQLDSRYHRFSSPCLFPATAAMSPVAAWGSDTKMAHNQIIPMESFSKSLIFKKHLLPDQSWLKPLSREGAGCSPLPKCLSGDRAMIHQQGLPQWRSMGTGLSCNILLRIWNALNKYWLTSTRCLWRKRYDSSDASSGSSLSDDEGDTDIIGGAYDYGL